ncbi:D-glycero-beta-D-manno-heptose 1,7-bisphosphate 7-phosphatase [Magnetofaba australis]|uniref:D,D-heptose 1,7-bisphosphate phosphatase n=1 Tax=Magnetofaba australis IT-1 TaxID=1434232 RepID=A0A1Y2K5I5_9PROT|nr:D-glycero-beta-D-manno-heptose 1,7-bisphosphate 7-phosphatase [Magnetofaba australis]OSM04941.1 putative D-alpha,beta-D-heptose 1,7-bisphosphate phosphatase [Magnetofaba australis IT-1]
MSFDDQPTVLLDRDGVINEERSNYVLTIEQMRFIPGSLEAIARLTRAGVRVAVVTNQACIGRGLLTELRLQEIHRHLNEQVAAHGGQVAAIYHCPHHPDDGCDCRKPKPGMLLAAQKQFNLDMAQVWFVGDSPSDMGAARAAGTRGALLRSGLKNVDDGELPDTPRFDNLERFVDAYLDGQLRS